ncbi:MAG: hypothetical protein IKR31_04730 [Prevotella sp.]|nr:hypothetical protein [Prevotella sp.]
MKKYLLSFAVVAMAMSLMTACSSDDDDAPVMKPVDVSSGMFIVGSGNKSAGIDGNVSYIDYSKGVTVPNAFQAANGKSVGKTANYITAYGSKLYIVVDGEATIWVCNKQTLKVEKQISTTQLLGDADGMSPRAAIGYEGKLYFTCYGASATGGNGIVAAIDTIGFAKQQTYTVGSYPDGLTLCGGYIFVANSDYGMNVKPTISKIDLKSGAVSEIKDAAITNPMHILTIGNDVYYLDYGTYDENWNQTGQGVRKITMDGKVTKLIAGTTMGTDGKRIFTADAPYGKEVKYYIYDTATGGTSTWEPADIFSPAVIAADPITSNIFIVSYQKNPDTGYAGYALPSYTNQYDATGKLVKKYENTATGPISVVFNTHTEYVKQ